MCIYIYIKVIKELVSTNAEVRGCINGTQFKRKTVILWRSRKDSINSLAKVHVVEGLIQNISKGYLIASNVRQMV